MSTLNSVEWVVQTTLFISVVRAIVCIVIVLEAKTESLFVSLYCVWNVNCDSELQHRGKKLNHFSVFWNGKWESFLCLMPKLNCFSVPPSSLKQELWLVAVSLAKTESWIVWKVNCDSELQYRGKKLNNFSCLLKCEVGVISVLEAKTESLFCSLSSLKQELWL